MTAKSKGAILTRPPKSETRTEYEKFDVKLVYKIVNSKPEFEKLKADLEAEGYTLHSKERYFEDGEIKRYSAKVLAAKWFPIVEETPKPEKKLFKLVKPAKKPPAAKKKPQAVKKKPPLKAKNNKTKK